MVGHDWIFPWISFGMEAVYKGLHVFNWASKISHQKHVDCCVLWMGQRLSTSGVETGMVSSKHYIQFCEYGDRVGPISAETKQPALTDHHTSTCCTNPKP